MLQVQDIYLAPATLYALCLYILGILLQDSVNAASGFRNCIAKIRRFLLYGLFAIAAYVIKMQLKKKRGSIVCYDTPFFNLSEFYQVAMIILLPE